MRPAYFFAHDHDRLEHLFEDSDEIYVIQDVRSKEYYEQGGGWTEDPTAALQFHNYYKAFVHGGSVLHLKHFEVILLT